MPHARTQKVRSRQAPRAMPRNSALGTGGRLVLIAHATGGQAPPYLLQFHLAKGRARRTSPPRSATTVPALTKSSVSGKRALKRILLAVGAQAWRRLHPVRSEPLGANRHARRV